MTRLAALALLALLGCATPRSVSHRATVIRNATLFDGQQSLGVGDIVIAGERIIAAGPHVETPAGAQVIDGTGQTVLPGLINSHFHVTWASGLRWAVQFGVTTVVDLHTIEPLFRRVRARPNAERFDEADFYGVGQLIEAAEGLHVRLYPGYTAVRSADDCRSAVQHVVDEGADFVKLAIDDGTVLGVPAPVMSGEVLAACISEAHAHQKQVLVHAIDVTLYPQLVAAGVDGLVHGPFVGRLTEQSAKLLAERHLFVVPTVTTYAALAREDGGRRLEPFFRDALAPWEQSALLDEWGPEWGKGFSLDVGRENLKRLMALGVDVLVGDDGGSPGTAMGASIHAELEELVALGYSPAQALRAATSLPAERLRLPDVGRLVAGARADLLLVDGDPTRDITATRRLVAVFKRGRRVDRAPLLAHARAERAVMTLLAEKDLASAARLLRAHLADHPDCAEFLYQLACVTQRLGAPGAMELLAQVIALDPGYAPRARFDSDLAPLRGSEAFEHLVPSAP